jgi:hypothetical protein
VGRTLELRSGGGEVGGGDGSRLAEEGGTGF